MLTGELRGLSDGELATRAMNGDRAAAAEFLKRNERVLANRYRWRLRRQPNRLTDTDDFLSTLARRLDRVVAERRVLASGPGRLFALINRVADMASREAVRRSHRVHARERAGAHADIDQSWAQQLAARDLDELLDRSHLGSLSMSVVRGRGAGLTHAQIAERLGISADVVRQRYSRAIAQLRTELAESTAQGGV